MQRLAALQRRRLRLCSGWRLRSGEAAALQQLAASQRLEERKRSALPERVPLRQRKVVVAGETDPLRAGQRMLHRTTRRTLQTCGGAQLFSLMNVKAA